ncbi:acyl-CoA dehydrogenase [Nocardioides immobilis]|uniref:Acyl-CoA dehydrogenase n=1 Tax=Nocardioides immobilis TaxID=2049295 RepID=A0A417Y6P1_9ACTN|nr:acyl-CoA dehydrogenase family protein [Nocardioides immobilis]RHW28378.1 acyl-CoA dehydrogenase [Nocardioides immobilis]
MDFSLTPELADFQRHLHSWVDSKLPKAAAREWEAREHEYPVELWDLMAEQGLHAVGLPEEYGGSGVDVLSQVIIGRELSRTLGGLVWIWGLSSFCARSIAESGSEALKADLLPRLAGGEIKIAIAVTEPSGGTDLLGSMRTTARKVEGGWLVRGQKIWSTAAHVSDYLLVLAKSDPDAERPSRGMTLFLIPNPSKGLEIRQIPKLGMRAVGSCEVFLDDVFVPDEYIVGDVHDGWRGILTSLNNERIIVSSLCLGVLDGVLEDAVQYMKERHAFGRPIGQFQALQHYVADMAMWQMQSELAIYRAAWLQQTGQDVGTAATMAKVIASDYATKAADLGIQILGGMGYAQETDMQRYWRDVRLYRIGPITNEMGKNLIAESFGLGRSF